MTQIQIRGSTQIMDLSIDNTNLIDGTLTLGKLNEGSKIILSDGTVAMLADLNLDGNKVINVATPTAATDAANKGYVDSSISALSAGVELAGDWDASSGAFPAGSLKGNLYVVTVAGTVDSVAYNVGDNIIATIDAASTTDSTDWILIDNSESSDIIRDADISTNLDLSVDALLLTDRATIKANIDSAISALGTNVYNEELTVTDSLPTVSALANTPTVGTVRVFLNGLRVMEGAGRDYTISGNQITFEYNLHTNDYVYVDYNH